MRQIAFTAFFLAAASMILGALPLKSATTATMYERPSRSAKLWIDQEIDWKIDAEWTVLAGADYAAAGDGSFFSVPEKAGGRIGAVRVLHSGMYLDAFAGFASWFADGRPSITSAVVEAAWNAEGAVWYLGIRDRLLINADSIVSISTLRGKWYPNELFTADARILVAAESGLGLSPGVLAEVTTAPFSAIRPLFFGVGVGGTYYARSFAEGAGYGTEGSVSAILGAKDEPGYSARLTATRRFGGRSGDVWEIEAVIVKQL